MPDLAHNPGQLERPQAIDIRQLLAEKKTVQVEGVHPNCTLRETAEKLIHHRIGALVVTDQTNRLIGIVSERDLIHAVAKHDTGVVNNPVSDVMTRSVITCEPGDEIVNVLRLMNSNGIRHMPVLDCGKLAGMVSIRELTTAYELLRIEANTDALTELSNRRPFLKTLTIEFDRARRYGHPLSVAMIDIDHFKRVNDTHGHDVGDKVLRAISEMLISEFRAIDLVGRLGGEEFAVVFPETDLVGAKLACDRFLADIRAAEIPVDGTEITITVSIGLAGASSDKTDGPAILKRADELLYDAKNGGRNRIVVEGEVACTAKIRNTPRPN